MTKIKDKVIIVFYVGVEDINKEDIYEYLDKVSKLMEIRNDNSVFQYFVPVMDSVNCRVECINPVLVSEEKYAEALQKLEEAKERLDKAIEELSEKKNK